MKIKDGYIFIISFLVIILTGFIVRFFYPDNWKWFEIFDTASAVALALLAVWGYFEYSKGEDDIKIIFDVEGEQVDTGFSILRKNFTRGEVLGVLGMIPTVDGKKFSLEFTSNGDFLKAVNTIQKGKSKKFLIPMTKSEREQFKLKK